MLKIKCDRCGEEIADKDLAAEVCVRPRAFALGDKRGSMMQYELCPACVQAVQILIKDSETWLYHRDRQVVNEDENAARD